MDDRYFTIGAGYAEWDTSCAHPYEVLIDTQTGNDAFLILSEGVGHANFAGYFRLREMLTGERRKEQLEICGCEFLIELAREEGERNTAFSAGEVLQRFNATKDRTKS